MKSSTTLMINSILDQSFNDKAYNVSTESVEHEVERVFYYKLTLEALEELVSKASKVYMEQAEIFSTTKEGKYMCSRVRHVSKPEFKPGDGGGGKTYTFTQKVGKSVGVSEYNFNISKNDFDSFLEDSDTHVKKYRIKMPVEGYPQLNYEIDVHFHNSGKGFCSWVKVDVEIDIKKHPELMSATLPKFPYDYTESIVVPWNKMSREEINLKDSIYKSYNLKEHK